MNKEELSSKKMAGLILLGGLHGGFHTSLFSLTDDWF